MEVDEFGLDNIKLSNGMFGGLRQDFFCRLLLLDA